jgi:hypothetical protein
MHHGFERFVFSFPVTVDICVLSQNSEARVVWMACCVGLCGSYHIHTSRRAYPSAVGHGLGALGAGYAV